MVVCSQHLGSCLLPPHAPGGQLLTSSTHTLTSWPQAPLGMWGFGGTVGVRGLGMDCSLGPYLAVAYPFKKVGRVLGRGLPQKTLF